jgi:hypothetical protein
LICIHNDAYWKADVRSESGRRKRLIRPNPTSAHIAKSLAFAVVVNFFVIVVVVIVRTEKYHLAFMW